jgi:hypothetical protein
MVDGMTKPGTDIVKEGTPFNPSVDEVHQTLLAQNGIHIMENMNPAEPVESRRPPAWLPDEL